MLRLQNTEKALQPPQLNTGVAYIFWCLCFFQFHGIQRLYAGKTLSGLIYLCTFGIFGIGQLLDLFFIPGMVKERNTYLRGLYYEEKGADVTLDIGKIQVPTFGVTDLANELSPMHKLLKVAKDNGGAISPAQALLLTKLEPDQLESVLQDALRRGYAEIGNDPETGSVRYYFDL